MFRDGVHTVLVKQFLAREISKIYDKLCHFGFVGKLNSCGLLASFFTWVADNGEVDSNGLPIVTPHHI